MTTRPTELKLFLENCPGAVALYRDGAPQDRSIFHAGTACHEILEALASGVSWSLVVARLVGTGRTGTDAEPPLPADAIAEGRDLARFWVEKHGTPSGTPEEAIGLDSSAHGVRSDGDLMTRIDLVYDDFGEDYEGADLSIVVGRDYKTSWRAGEHDVDSVQRRIHALCLWDVYADADAIRVEVAAIRTGRIHSRTLVRGEDDHTIEEWREQVRPIIQLIKSGALNFAPGAGCLRCPYAGYCPSAWELATDEALDPVARYVAAKAIADAMQPLAKAATTESPRTVNGVSVGYHRTTSKAPKPDAPDAIVSRWTSAHDAAWDDATVSALLGVLKLGTTQVKSFVKAMHPGRGTKDARTAAEIAMLEDKHGKQWGAK